MKNLRILSVLLAGLFLSLNHCTDTKAKATAPGEGEVQINGVLAEGTALAGQTVVVKDAAGNELGSTTTGEDGSYSLNVPDSGNMVVSGGEQNLSAVVLSSDLSSENSAGSLAASTGRILRRNLNPVGDAVYRRVHGEDLSQLELGMEEAKQARQAFADKALGQGVNLDNLLEGEFTAYQEEATQVQPSASAVLVKSSLEVVERRGVAGVKQMLDGIAENAQGVPFFNSRDAQVELGAQFTSVDYNPDEVFTEMANLIDVGSDLAAEVRPSVQNVATVMETIYSDSQLTTPEERGLAVTGLKETMHYMVNYSQSSGSLDNDQMSSLVTNVGGLASEGLVSAVKAVGGITFSVQYTIIIQIGTYCGGLIKEETTITTTIITGSELTNKKDRITDLCNEAVALLKDGGNPDDMLTLNIGGNISGLNANGLKVRINNQNEKTITAGATSYSWELLVINGEGYLVTISAQPAGQLCRVSNESGTLSGSVSNVEVTCVNKGEIDPNFASSGTLVFGTIGSDSFGTVVENNGVYYVAGNANTAFGFFAVNADGTMNGDNPGFFTGYCSNGSSGDQATCEGAAANWYEGVRRYGTQGASSSYMADPFSLSEWVGRTTNGDIVVTGGDMGAFSVYVYDPTDWSELFSQTAVIKSNGYANFGVMDGNDFYLINNGAVDNQNTVYAYNSPSAGSYQVDTGFNSTGSYTDLTSGCGRPQRGALDVSRGLLITQSYSAGYKGCPMDITTPATPAGIGTTHQLDGTIGTETAGGYGYGIVLLDENSDGTNDSVLYAGPAGSGGGIALYIYDLDTNAIQTTRDTIDGDSSGVIKIDLSTAAPGLTWTYPQAAFLDNEGKLVLAGVADSGAGSYTVAFVARLIINPTSIDLDTTFGGGDGVLTFDGIAGGSGTDKDMITNAIDTGDAYVAVGVSQVTGNLDGFMLKITK